MFDDSRLYQAQEKTTTESAREWVHSIYAILFTAGAGWHALLLFWRYSTSVLGGDGCLLVAHFLSHTAVCLKQLIFTQLQPRIPSRLFAQQQSSVCHMLVLLPTDATQPQLSWSYINDKPGHGESAEDAAPEEGLPPRETSEAREARQAMDLSLSLIHI